MLEPGCLKQCVVFPEGELHGRNNDNSCCLEKDSEDNGDFGDQLLRRQKRRALRLMAQYKMIKGSSSEGSGSCEE
ncbi:hypothetical protein V6N13_075519 [Hibiscus sabdariffa]